MCDPYLKVELAGTKKRFGNRKDHVKETLAPWFYKSFAFTTELPGCSQLNFKLLGTYWGFPKSHHWLPIQY
jgi:hypothetical protein